MLRLVTAGESHGPGISCILTGVPSGLALDVDGIDRELARRQTGYGRSGRQEIERDRVEILAGVRKGVTTGNPLALMVRNRDARLDDPEATPELFAPRPGHADLAGHQATGAPIRDVIERASARETAARVSAGAVAKQLLGAFEIEIASHVTRVGDAASSAAPQALADFARTDESPVRCLDEVAARAMCAAIDSAREAGESAGGVFEVAAFGMPAGLGSYAEREKGIDARLASALVAIPAIKGVEIGAGFAAAALVGSQVHDEIFPDPDAARAGGFARRTNRAGGIEGGVTNGMPVVVRAAMKPIPTLTKPLRSVDIRTRKPVEAAKERSDVCAVAAASVVAESVVALTLADALLERLGTGSLAELRARFDAMVERMGGDEQA
jgi:chorismate synthase